MLELDGTVPSVDLVEVFVMLIFEDILVIFKVLATPGDMVKPD